jgi:cell division protein FtsL
VRLKQLYVLHGVHHVLKVLLQIHLYLVTLNLLLQGLVAAAVNTIKIQLQQQQLLTEMQQLMVTRQLVSNNLLFLLCVHKA